MEPSLSPGPCLPACRTHTCRPPAPYCHITECCQQKCCHITECVQSDKHVGGGRSHIGCTVSEPNSKDCPLFFTQVFATPRSASRRAARGTMDSTQSDWPGGRDTKEYLGHKKKVHSLAWNCSGEKLASGSVDQSVRSAPSAASSGHGGSMAAFHPTPSAPAAAAPCPPSRQPPPLAGSRLGPRPVGPLDGH